MPLRSEAWSEPSRLASHRNLGSPAMALQCLFLFTAATFFSPSNGTQNHRLSGSASASLPPTSHRSIHSTDTNPQRTATPNIQGDPAIPARASRLQSWPPVRRVAEHGSFGPLTLMKSQINDLVPLILNHFNQHPYRSPFAAPKSPGDCTHRLSLSVFVQHQTAGGGV